MCYDRLRTSRFDLKETVCFSRGCIWYDSRETEASLVVAHRPSTGEAWYDLRQFRSRASAFDGEGTRAGTQCGTSDFVRPITNRVLICRVQHWIRQALAEKIKNLSTFERSLMSGVTNVSAQRATEFKLDCCLLGRCAPLPGCLNVIVADRLSVGDSEISRGDVVACGGELLLVTACFQEGATLGVLREASVIRRWLAPNSAVIASSGRLLSRFASQVVLCVAWKDVGGGELLVVLS